MLIIQKYGGTSLQDSGCILRAAKRLTDSYRQGHSLVAVVSAQGQTTDEMIARAHGVNPRPSRQEMDAYMAAGEQMSACLMAMAIGALGCRAVSLTGWQAGIHTDSCFGSARITHVDPTPIQEALGQGKIAVVAGFQGLDDQGCITTLGRGGSDTTAVALAVALGADKCQIYTDVDGVYDRDPRRFSDAVRFDRIGYGEMLRLIASGAQVLHDRSVELAKDAGLPLEVLSAFQERPGTVVGPMDESSPGTERTIPIFSKKVLDKGISL